MRRRAFGVGVLGLMGGVAAWTVCDGWAEAAPDPISLTGTAEAELVPADATSEVWALIRVDAAEADDEQRPPIGVALLIDTSGSMEGEPIAGAREAAAEVIAALRDGDYLSVVAFDSTARVLVETTEIDGGSRDDALERVAKMRARGTTNLAAGLGAALQQLRVSAVAGTVNRIVLLSDGVPNDAAPIAGLASEAQSMDVTITALGFGLDYDETLLGQLAQQTGGSFHYIEDASEITPAFREENARLQGVVASGMRLSLFTGPKVEIAEVVGLSGVAGNQAGAALGDLSRGQERVVAVRLRVGPHRDGASVELLDASLEYRDPLAAEPRMVHKSVFIAAHASADTKALAASRTPAVSGEVASQLAAAATLHAVAATRAGDIDEARRTLDVAIPLAQAAAEEHGEPDLAEQATQMERVADDLSDTNTLQDGEGAAAAPRQRATRNEAHRDAMKQLQAR